MSEAPKPGKVFDQSWREQAEKSGRLVRIPAPKRMAVSEAKKAGIKGLDGLPDKLIVYVQPSPSPQK